MEIDLSTLDEDDLTECAALYVDTFQEHPWHETWSMDDAFDRLSDFLTCPKSIAIKATINDTINGFLFAEVQQWNGATYGYLKDLCVSPKMQRHGIGTQLIGKLEETLREQGISKLYLITQRSSTLLSFYASVGYSENVDVVVMAKSLDQSG